MLVDSAVRTSAPDEPVNSDTSCCTGEGNVVLPRTGSGELVNGVTRTSRLDDPDGSCDVAGQVYVCAVVLCRTGSDQKFDNVVSIVGYETGSVTDASGDVVVMSSECREVDKATLHKIRMCKINPRLELKVHYSSAVWKSTEQCMCVSTV